MTKLQAHRGVSSEYPENTMVAYQAAIEQGYAIIELDPKYTADGKIVMLHDKSIKRTARDKNGESHDIQISELTLEQAREYEYGSWKGQEFKGEQIPTLSDVLDFSEKNPSVPLKLDNVWTKFPDDVRASLLKEIADRGNSVNVGMTCGSIESVKEVVEALPNACIHYDGIDLSDETLTKIAELSKGRLVIWVCYDLPRLSWFKGERASAELCERVRKYGKLGIWILSTREELESAAVNFKADYVETNGRIKPEWLKDIEQ